MTIQVVEETKTTEKENNTMLAEEHGRDFVSFFFYILNISHISHLYLPNVLF